jgi:hypothetical protein
LVSSTADVMRLLYSPTSVACCTSSTRSLRAVGSPPEKWNLQHADFGELAQNLLPFLGRQFAAAAVEFDRVGAIGALQRAAVRQLASTAKRNAERLRGRAVAIPEPRARRWARRRLFCHRRECRS